MSEYNSYYKKKLKHVQIKESHLEILVPKSKTGTKLHREGDLIKYNSRIYSWNYGKIFSPGRALISNKEIFIISCVFKTKTGQKFPNHTGCLTAD